MTTVTVYRFRRWSAETGDYEAPSTRMGTREGIARIGGQVIDGSAVEVDDALLDREEPGLTDKDFDPVVF